MHNTGANEGLTRREALRRGAFLGAGLLWVAPAASSIRLAADTAAVASGGTTTTTRHTTRSSSPPSSEPPPPTEVEGNNVSVGGIQVEPPGPVSAQELPFTGLPLDQIAPVAGGLLATGAAALYSARDRKQGRHEGGADEVPADGE